MNFFLQFLIKSGCEQDNFRQNFGIYLFIIQLFINTYQKRENTYENENQELYKFFNI